MKHVENHCDLNEGGYYLFYNKCESLKEISICYIIKVKNELLVKFNNSNITSIDINPNGYKNITHENINGSMPIMKDDEFFELSIIEISELL